MSIVKSKTSKQPKNVNRLSVKTNNPTSKNKTLNLYTDIISKYSDAEPVKGRRARESETKKRIHTP